MKRQYIISTTCWLVIALSLAACGSQSEVQPAASSVPSQATSSTPAPQAEDQTAAAVTPQAEDQTAVATTSSLAASSTPPPTTATSDPLTPTPDTVGKKIDVGGRNLYIRCEGTGSPTVILDSGLGNDWTTWSDVMPEVSRFTQVCAYDRAGVGRSDPVSPPRTTQDMVADLNTLLSKANIPGPYVLVGHSIAGFNVRLYANKYPDSVAGVVLVDSTHPDQTEAFTAALPSESPSESECVANIRQGMKMASDPKVFPEGLDLEASEAQVRAAGSLGDLPLVVVTRGKSGCDTAAPEDAAGLDQAWQKLQSEFVALSSNGLQITAERSGHLIPTEQPEAVIDAIQRVVDKVKGP
jgi:pimeloyl-ACP methyl ester carboxylesterase